MLNIENIKYVIFDLDGTLIDTEKLYNEYWRKACAIEGFSLSYSEALNLRSLDSQLAREYFNKLFGSNFDYNSVRNIRRKLMSEYLNRAGKISPKPYVADFLNFLNQNNIKTAICSASSVDTIVRNLDLAGIPNTFQDLISVNMVTRGKPHPDVYLFACEKLGVPPPQTIAVEDAPNGVISAKKAGCHVVMIPDLSEPTPKESECIDYIARDFKELLFLFDDFFTGGETFKKCEVN